MEPKEDRQLSAQKSSQVKKEGKKVHFRWSKDMSKELLEFLAEEVRKGNRPNNTFRTSSFVAAAKVISEKFQVTCLADHVENHMKTIRNSWVTISKVRSTSGFGWNDSLKMITASPKTSAAYLKAYPSHDKFLNRSIELYEEMEIVAGKDLARGNFAKTFTDIDDSNDIDDNVQPSMTVESAPSKSESGNSSGSRPHRKRSRTSEEGSSMEHISDQLTEVVSALKKFSNNQLDVEKLYEEIMKMESVEEGIRMAAFDHLVEREMLAKAFLTKSIPLRKLWMDNFVKSLMK